MNLKGRSFLTLLDFNKDEIRYMLDLAHELKAKKKKGIQGEELKGKNIVLVFDKHVALLKLRQWMRVHM